jgi:hypothetical protein
MVRVRFTTSEYRPELGRFDAQLRAELIVDGRETTTIGDPRWVSLDVSVVDPDSRDDVTFELNPERWARLLPLAYRSGDLTAEVVEEMAVAGMGEERHPY